MELEDLFKPSKQKVDIEEAMKYVKNVHDERILQRIASEATYAKVRSAAIENITSQAFLKDEALNSIDSGIIRAVFSKITDQAFLKEVVFSPSNWSVRPILAVKNITDEVFLKDVALNHSNRDVRLAAVKNMTDVLFLKELVTIAINGKLTVNASSKRKL